MERMTMSLGVAGVLLLLLGVAGLGLVAILHATSQSAPAPPARADVVSPRGSPRSGTWTRCDTWRRGRAATPRVASLGERIYVLGAGEDGGAIPRTAAGPGMMGGVACTDCHGADGTGGTFRMMMQVVSAPDIRYESLTAQHDEHGDGGESWTDDDIRRAVEEGVEPDGETLDPVMPRWRLSDREFDALLDYLKELSE